MEGNTTKEETILNIKKNTRRFAKRQGTWFRKNKNINWFNYKTSTLKIFNYIEHIHPIS